MGFVDSLKEAASTVSELPVVGGFVNGVTKFSDPSYWYEQNRADNLNQENMNFQREMQERSYDMAFENWMKEFNIESEWNSPTSQVSRLLAAGINPAVQNAAMNGTMNLPSAVGGNPSPVPMLEGTSHSDSALKNAAEGLHASILNTKTKDMLNAEIQQKLSEAGYKETLQALTQWETYLSKVYGRELKEAELNKLVTDVLLNKELSAEAATKAANNMIDGAIKTIEEKLKGEELNQAKIVTNTLREKILSEIQKNRAQSSQALAAAEESREQAVDARTFRDNRNAILGLQRDLAEVEKDVKKSTSLLQALADLENRQLVNRELVQRVRKLYKENRYEDVRQVVDILQQATRAYLNLAAAGNQQSQSFSQFLKIFAAGKSGTGYGSDVVPWVIYGD